MQDKVTILQDRIETLKQYVNKSIDWTNIFLKGQQKEQARFNQIKIRRRLNTFQNALNYNSSAALYGESQVGKSYLVKNLLSNNEGVFTVKDFANNKEYNYLEEINPKGGGVEATSLVTRFTTNTTIPNEEFPIKINILSPKDITLILLDSCMSELRESLAPLREEEIVEKVEELKVAYRSQSAIQDKFSEDDIYDIKEYLEEHFKSATLTQNLRDANYWNEISYIIPKLDFNDWYKAIGILWANHDDLNEIFNKLINGLNKLRFSEYAYVKFKAVLRKHGTLLDVSRLRSLNLDIVNDENEDAEEYLNDVDVFLEKSNATVVIEKPTLCGLVGELVFKLNPSIAEDKTFLNNLDLLDFPGARERKEIKKIRKSVDNVILRGKVAYLFNKYSAEYLISNLLLCNRSMQIGTPYLAKILNKWISSFIGEDRDQRTRILDQSKIAPLFIIYTWFNTDLAYDDTNDKSKDKLKEKWKKRFKTIFKGEFVTKDYNWDEEWAADRFFKNNYMLRDPKFSVTNNIFKVKNNQELEHVQPEQYPNYWEDLKDTFVNYDFVKQHFEDPELTWQESATPNQDGTVPIIRNLTVSGEINIRLSKLIDETQKTYHEFVSEIHKYYHSDEGDKLILNAQKKAGAIELDLSTSMRKDQYVFGRLIKALIVSESDAFNYYHEEIDKIETLHKKDSENYTAILIRNQEISNTKTFEENIEVLRKNYNLGSPDDVKREFESKGIDLEDLFFGDTDRIKSNSEILASGFVDYWLENFLKLERFSSVLEADVSETSLVNLFNNIQASFEKIDIKEKIAKSIRQYVDRYDKVDTVQFMISDISACIINNFINTMGFCYLEDEGLEDLKTANKENELGLSFNHDFLDFEELEEEQLLDLFHTTDNLEQILNETPIDRNKLKNIPNYSHFLKWNDLMRISFLSSCDIPTYDVLANNQLGDIIDHTEQIELNV